VGPVKSALKDAGVSPGEIDEVILVGGQTRMPRVQQVVKDVFGKELHKGVNPDEVVAIGAAIQAGVLAGDVRDVVLLDVTPLSVGIETLGNVMTRLIERNTTIPTRKGEIFTTAADNQTSVEIHVLQGEREMARDNRTLGRFHLVGIPSAPRGIPQIEVTFDIDANGILNVGAKDTATAKEQKITITHSSGLAKEEIDRMVKEADSHAAEDKQRRKEIEARNQLDSLIYTTEKMLNENRDKIPVGEISGIEEALQEGKKALESGNADQIRQAIEQITKASHKMAEAMYQRAQTEQQAPGAETAGEQAAGGERPAEGEVVDAEFEDLGGGKKSEG
ncbi:MAG: Hsp70 family protein, partial [Candidatus Methylomirabilales bacterium]